MGLSERILNLMEKRKLSRYKLAKLTKVPYTTLIKILDGTTKNPQVDSLAAIADFFNVTTDYLLGRSIYALIEKRLVELGLTSEDVERKMEWPQGMLESLDTFPPAPWDYERGEMIDILAKFLNMDFKSLSSAFARQEPPVYDGPHINITAEEDFGSVDFKEKNVIEAVSKEPTEKQILTLAAHCVGHKGALSGRELEQVKMALRIALAK